jgi:predicted transcriptional regulator
MNIEKIILEKLISEGNTLKQISKNLGISRYKTRIQLKLYNLKTIYWKPSNPPLKEKMEELIEKNFSSYRIAEEMGYSQTNIRYWLEKYGLKTHPLWYIIRKEKSQEILSGYKTCPKCKIKMELNKENFYFKKNGSFHYWCKKCNDIESLKKQRQMKINSVNYKGGKCCICGYNKYVGSMDFHHIDPSKKDFSISQLRTYSWEKIKLELDKCMLVCKNCHGEIHSRVVAEMGHDPITSPL